MQHCFCLKCGIQCFSLSLYIFLASSVNFQQCPCCNCLSLPAPSPVPSPHLYKGTTITTFRKTVYYKTTTETQLDMTNSRRRHHELKTKTAFHATATRACTNMTYTRRTQNNVLQHPCPPPLHFCTSLSCLVKLYDALCYASLIPNCQ